MRRRRDLQIANLLSRRDFLQRTKWMAPLLVPAPLGMGLGLVSRGTTGVAGPDFAGPRLVPHYPSPSPLDAMLGLVAPGNDAYVTEKTAAQLQAVFARWAATIKKDSIDWRSIAEDLLPGIQSNALKRLEERGRRVTGAVEVRARDWTSEQIAGRDSVIAALREMFAPFQKVSVAEFELIGVRETSEKASRVSTQVRCSFAGKLRSRGIEERIGTWVLDWDAGTGGDWRVAKWMFERETISRTASPLFVDISEAALGGCESYRKQFLVGTDEWRSVLDGASGIDVYGNNGIAAGDFDNDGFDDLYICQPSGLPNRLYRNCGDGTFEDVTEKAGVAVLDATSCALFADFLNRGHQDLLVVCETGPLLFLNQGDGKFEQKPDAFNFAKLPQGTFTHAALADYDRDGKLDVYFCLYTYYLGLDQYHYPSPYFDARNGPANFLFHNQGDGTFVDRTEATGLNAENDRYSFACAWGDANGDGWPDLYVANDFGRSNLYRNNGDGTFAAISDQSGANDVGAGMSACWLDASNSGKQDIYVSNMWSAAGQRVSGQAEFHTKDSAEVKAAYRRHARGNSFYKNLGDGRFKNLAADAGNEMGRWAWSSDSWDFDHDGFADLYVANGYVSGSEPQELSSFFWRQVVGNSPPTATPLTAYEQGWSAINELIRSDHTWAGYERNVLFANNGDGKFSDISGVSGLDFLDDSRAFALADLNHDRRLEVILKNRTAPQIRILQNNISELGDSISIRLRGTKSNRDAIGAAVTIRCGQLVQTKYLQAGTGFLSQHSKEIFFGLGKSTDSVSATVRWPSGLAQTFANLPRNNRISLEEGATTFGVVPFTQGRNASVSTASLSAASPTQHSSEGTWLIEPLSLPELNLQDASLRRYTLEALHGKPAALHFWSSQNPDGTASLQELNRDLRKFSEKGIQLLAINLDAETTPEILRSIATRENLSVPLLAGTPTFAGAYNLIYRFLFDRRRDLPFSCTFLLDESGRLVKVYQEAIKATQLLEDAQTIPKTYEERIAKALPFPGKLYRGAFQRNDFTYGVTLFQHGYLDEAASSFRQVIAAKPDNAEAHYNLGTLYLRKGDLTEARRFLEKATSLQPEYPEAWNNLGMIAGQQNDAEKAVQYFEKSVSQRPGYVTALLNLGNTYRRQGKMAEAAQNLSRALDLEPENPEANYSLGMLYARQGDSSRAESLIQKAISLRPDYPDARNNLGVLFIREGRNAEAEKQFQSCIDAAPTFDQAYLNLAQLYMIEKQNEKARATLEALLKLQPEHKLARQALEMLH